MNKILFNLRKKKNLKETIKNKKIKKYIII